MVWQFGAVVVADINAWYMRLKDISVPHLPLAGHRPSRTDDDDFFMSQRRPSQQLNNHFPRSKGACLTLRWMHFCSLASVLRRFQTPYLPPVPIPCAVCDSNAFKTLTLFSPSNSRELQWHKAVPSPFEQSTQIILLELKVVGCSCSIWYVCKSRALHILILPRFFLLFFGSDVSFIELANKDL